MVLAPLQTQLVYFLSRAQETAPTEWPQAEQHFASAVSRSALPCKRSIRLFFRPALTLQTISQLSHAQPEQDHAKRKHPPSQCISLSGQVMISRVTSPTDDAFLRGVWPSDDQKLVSPLYQVSIGLSTPTSFHKQFSGQESTV